MTRSIPIQPDRKKTFQISQLGKVIFPHGSPIPRIDSVIFLYPSELFLILLGTENLRRLGIGSTLVLNNIKNKKRPGICTDMQKIYTLHISA